jgi:BMFP domain-containing protein YqiC
MRYLCPLACGWTHDQGVPDFSAVPGGTAEEIVRAGLMRQYTAEEIIVREHLESHELIEWVAALTAARAERDRLAARVAELEAQAVLPGPQRMLRP